MPVFAQRRADQLWIAGKIHRQRSCCVTEFLNSNSAPRFFDLAIRREREKGVRSGERPLEKL
jgi:hypothetical protein